MRFEKPQGHPSSSAPPTYMMVGGAEIRLEHAFELGRDRTSHEHERVDGKKRILAEFRDVVPANKALRLQRLVFRLVPDSAKRLGRRHIVGRLVDAAEQDRNIFELHTRAPFDTGKGKLRQIGIRAAEIELKFNFQ